MYALVRKKRIAADLFRFADVLVRLTGFEPVTYGLEVRCSIQLSYRRISKNFPYHSRPRMSIAKTGYRHRSSIALGNFAGCRHACSAIRK